MPGNLEFNEGVISKFNEIMKQHKFILKELCEIRDLPDEPEFFNLKMYAIQEIHRIQMDMLNFLSDLRNDINGMETRRIV